MLKLASQITVFVAVGFAVYAPFFVAEPHCSFTSAPPGYVGDCSGGPAYCTGVSCAPGFYPVPWNYPHASCLRPWGLYEYSGCGMTVCMLLCVVRICVFVR